MKLDTFNIFSLIVNDSFQYQAIETEQPCKVTYIEIGGMLCKELFRE